MKEVEKLPTSILQRGKKKRVTASQGYPLLCFVKSPLGSSPKPYLSTRFQWSERRHRFHQHHGMKDLLYHWEVALMFERREFPILEFDPNPKAKIDPCYLTEKANTPECCFITFFGDVINEIL